MSNIYRDEMNNSYRGPSMNASYQVSVHLTKRFGRRRFVKIRNKNCLWWPCLLIDHDKMSNLQRGPSIDASYQVSVHLAERFQRRRRQTPSDGKSSHCLWQCELKRGNNSIKNYLIKMLYQYAIPNMLISKHEKS